MLTGWLWDTCRLTHITSPLLCTAAQHNASQFMTSDCVLQHHIIMLQRRHKAKIKDLEEEIRRLQAQIVEADSTEDATGEALNSVLCVVQLIAAVHAPYQVVLQNVSPWNTSVSHHSYCCRIMTLILRNACWPLINTHMT